MYKVFKRFFDFIAALLLFIAISPLFLYLAFLVKIKLGSPVFFKQIRSGRHEEAFYIMKFRMMSNATDSEGNFLADKDRFTKYGIWLRSSSLDELPELLNIIKGDMSVIGPRPLPPTYKEYYSDYEKSRFKVRGGLIPPESLYFNSFVTWDKQLKYEADYANNLSMSLDIRLLISVFKTIFKRTKTDYGEYARDPLNVERSKMNKDI